MPNLFVLFVSLIVCGAIARIISGKKGFWVIALGLAIGVTVAYATVSYWYLLGLLVFVPCLFILRKVAN